jgi:folate-binding protein YgfZ
MGPGAPDWLVREVFGLRAEGATLEALEEDAFLRMGEGPEGILVVRSGELAAPAWDVLAPGGVTSALLRRAREEGVPVAEPAVVETLRVEAGRPAFGVELDDGVIPTEAGLEARAVDHTKGCYTGQEVIVRIRDRGHVNRHLRGLVFPGDTGLPAGTLLMKEPGGREMGKVASGVYSPRAGRAIGLGWVRREVEVPGELLAGEEGVVVGVRGLPEAPKEGPVPAERVSWAL